ncbi:MAG TPA: DNA mismatch repair endonuclease MutL, partial [Candidatus Absconditabacterales bacterium]|nr:DNA mismatch repair endonuclease MutL [Candidatus Absconditabacterales bacterium]
MSIKKLPEYLINKLKAGEIVERPASVVKELLENSLDAGATKITLDINDGGKTMIRLEDNGSGIDIEDLDFVLERYATSKITQEEDLYNIASYGFRGEALASISEVSKFTLQTKTAGSQTGYQIQKVEDFVELKRIPIGFDHGTVVIIEELFFNTPVRQKFLKSAQTEYFYIYQLFVDFALVHFDKAMILKKNNNTVFNLQATDSIGQRFLDLFKKDRLDQIKTLDYSDEKIGLSGIIGDAALCFGAPDNIKLFVNQRPVNDKIMKKAILSAYDRQIKPGEYPLACVFLDIQPNLVDVNVHPRKLEVKFLDPGSIYNLVNMVIKQTLGEQKIMTMNQEFSKYQAHSSTPSYQSQGSIKSNNISSTLPAQSSFFQAQSVFQQNSLAQETVDESFSLRDSSGEYKLVG